MKRPKLVWIKRDGGIWQSQESVFTIRQVGLRFHVRDLVAHEDVTRATLATAKRWAASRA